MYDVFVYKTSDNVDDRIYFADVGEKFITETFAFAGTCNEPGNIDKFDGSRNDAVGLGDFTQWLKAAVGHLYHSNIWVDRTERVVRRLRWVRVR